MPAFAVAVDVGGTFIDFVTVDRDTGRVLIEKQPAASDDLVEDFLTGLRRMPLEAGAIDRLIHGSTVAINAILQQRGALVGLITTKGFRDVLELGRGERPQIYNWLFVPPDPLVPRELRREVSERTGWDGSEINALDLQELDRELDFLVERNVEAVAICFLHSYANPKHEQIAAERILDRHPQLAVTVSSLVATEWHEYERTSTASLNAFIQPLFVRYLRDLNQALATEGYAKPLAIMQSNGGVIESRRAAELPIRTLESGPAGGVIGAQAIARRLSHSNVICTDVGGTTYDVALIEGGEVLERTQTSIEGRPLIANCIDIVSIGAGGGSIAWVDDSGSLRVGPQSAGARPGPASFGFGGSDPTVTDCHLVLGRLDPENFLGSRMQLDVDGAVRAIRDRVASPLYLTVQEAAEGVLTIAEQNMTNAIHLMTVERGLDPREFVLYAYGGGGGLFAVATAEELDMGQVLVPPAPANFSAWGMLKSDFREDAALTRLQTLDPQSVQSILADLEGLRMQVVTELSAYGFEESALELFFRVDLRYSGQEHTISTPVEEAWLHDEAAILQGIRPRFDSMHLRLYGHENPEASVEAVTRRCRGIGRVEQSPWPTWTPKAHVSPTKTRPVFFAGDFVPTAIFERAELGAGQEVVGPAIVEEWTSTTVIPPGWWGVTDEWGNLLLRREEG